MPGKGCRKKGRKHTPIVSEKQRGLFGAELARKKAGEKGKTGMSKTVLRRHLKESKGKNLSKQTRRKTTSKSSPASSPARWRGQRRGKRR